MQKIILIIIATIINQIASGQGQREYSENGTLNADVQSCIDKDLISEPHLGTSLLCDIAADFN